MGSSATEQSTTAAAQAVANRQIVEELNQRGDGAMYTLDGPWSQMSPAQFKDRVLMQTRCPPTAAMHAAREPWHDPLQGMPSSFDWSTKGVVTPVRDQGALGACWALSATENVEGQLALASGSLMQLSAEQLIECDSLADASCAGQRGHGKVGCADCGMFGGWPYLAYQFLQRAGGIFSENTWPYQHKGIYPCMPEGYSKMDCGDHDDLHCQRNSTRGQGVDGLCHARTGFAAEVAGWRALSENETELAVQLVQYGPLSVLLDASNLQFYHSGVWRGGLLGCRPDPTLGVLGLNHAVVLVGFGSEGGAAYWKAKNSWGIRWGEQGYFRIQRGQGTCGINLAATTAKVRVAVLGNELLV